MKHHLFTLLILVAALAAYFDGFKASAGTFLVLGGMLELWFWLRAASKPEQPKAADQGV